MNLYTNLKKNRSEEAMQLELKCGKKFPFLHKAFQILQSIVPEAELSDADELMFVLRAYGKAVTGQNLQIEEIDHALDENNRFCGHIAFLDYGDTQASRDPMGRKTAGINQFNQWLREQGFRIVIQSNPKYLL